MARRKNFQGLVFDCARKILYVLKLTSVAIRMILVAISTAVVQILNVDNLILLSMMRVIFPCKKLIYGISN